jgi:hypothetical protein
MVWEVQCSVKLVNSGYIAEIRVTFRQVREWPRARKRLSLIGFRAGGSVYISYTPSNQIIHVKYEQGMELCSYCDAYYALGELSGQVVRNEMAESAYSMKAEAVEIFTY